MKNKEKIINTINSIFKIANINNYMEISYQDLINIINKNSNIKTSNYVVSSAIRELVRHGYFSRFGEKYLINRKNEVNIKNFLLNISNPSIKSIDKYFNKLKEYNNVISRKDINRIFNNFLTIDIDRIIMILLERNYVYKYQKNNSRGKYVIDQNDIFYSDPINDLIKTYGNKILFCYNTALELHGLSRYGMSFIIYVNKNTTTNNLCRIGETTIKPVNLKAPCIGKTKALRKNNDIFYTDLERTILDCLYRPKYAVGWENILYALNKIDKLDQENIIKYLKAIKIPSLFSKTGFILEKYREKWSIENNTLNTIKMYCSKTPVYFLRKVSGHLNKKWNIYIPDDLL